MRTDGEGDRVIGLLVEWGGGKQEALDELVPIVYREMRNLARAQLRNERADHTLQPTALANEAFMRLAGFRRVKWQDRAHFFAIASRIMRRILVEHARKRGAKKRGEAPKRVTLSDVRRPAEAVHAEISQVHDALTGLEAKDARQSQIVEMRYFGGLTIPEISEVLGISPATVKRDWRVAKLWLRRELSRT